MKIALAQLNFHVGNFAANTSKIIDAIKEARAQGAELIVFSEFSICGYPARDFLEYGHFVQQCEEALDSIRLYSKHIGILIGCPRKNPVPDGKDLFNSAYFFYEKKLVQIFDKTLLPTYDIFDEYRYFEPNRKFEVLHFKGKKLAITICEDIWNVGNENPLYTMCPLDELRAQEPDIIINLSASPFSYTQHEERMKVIRANVMRYSMPMVYVNQIGAQTELIFDGGSVVMNEVGEVIAQLPFFEEAVRTVEVQSAKPEQLNIQHSTLNNSASIHNALVLGIRDYFKKLGFRKAVLGLSGGIDSAIVLALAVEALGKNNVTSILLPSQYSSDHSIFDAMLLCDNLDSRYKYLPIEKTFQSFLETLEPIFENRPHNVAEENIQARVRGTLLMAFANKFGYILLNTTNKSEAAVGYGTLYGDMCGGISVLGDVYKTQVYELARYINRNTEVIPNNIITKAPSAELRPGQKDSDSLPPYDTLDEVLFQYIEKRRGPKEIIELGFDEKLVARVLRMVNMNEWKRFQAAPILRVSPKAFGMGRRMPLEGKYLG